MKTQITLALDVHFAPSQTRTQVTAALPLVSPKIDLTARVVRDDSQEPTCVVFNWATDVDTEPNWAPSVGFPGCDIY